MFITFYSIIGDDEQIAPLPTVNKISTITNGVAIKTTTNHLAMELLPTKIKWKWNKNKHPRSHRIFWATIVFPMNVNNNKQ